MVISLFHILYRRFSSNSIGNIVRSDGVASAVTMATSNDLVVYKACYSLFVIQTLSFHSNIVFFNIYVLLRICVRCGAVHTHSISLLLMRIVPGFEYEPLSLDGNSFGQNIRWHLAHCTNSMGGENACIRFIFTMIPWDARSLNILDNLRMTLAWMKCQREYTQNHVTHKYTFNVIIKMQKRKRKETQRMTNLYSTKTHNML